MPPRFGAAPKCARCDKSVFIAEQVIGPASRPYHKSCLTCISCGKRLDSTLLVEHEGDALCKNCHKAHLGQGKGGFSTAVPMRPHVPTSSRSQDPPPIQTPKPAFSYNTLAEENHATSDEVSQSMGNLDLADHVPEIRVSGRSGGGWPGPEEASTTYRSAPPAREEHRFSRPLSSDVVQRSTPSATIESSVRSIDDAISGSYDTPTISARATVQPGDDDAQPWQVASSAAPSTSRGSDTIGSVAAPSVVPSGNNGHVHTSSAGLPPPRRAQLGRTSGPTKVADPAPRHPTIQDDDDRGFKPGIGISRLGLAGSIANAKGGTPLCARCEKPVYFAEQRAAAGRKWHRACLRCDGCSTTLEAGKLEEGPPSAADAAAVARIRDPKRDDSNVWCRVCYAKHFGPRGIGVAGMSLPEAMGSR